MATTHKKYGGSSIERTMLCPGSVKAIAELPQRPVSPHAERGTRIHAWLERYLKNDLSVKAQTDQDKEEAMIAAKAGEKVKELIAHFGMSLSDFHQETFLDLAPDLQIAGGSPDLYGYVLMGDLVIIDYKGGSRRVKAEENHQLAFYACAVLNHINPFIRHTLNNCHMIIIQSSSEPPYDVETRIWTRPVADLPAYEALYRAAIIRAEQNPDERIPGEHCVNNYCDARTTCPQYLQWVASKQSEETAAIFLAAAQAESANERLRILLDGAKIAEDTFKQAKEDAKTLLAINPTAIPGWYLKTDVKGDREFNDKKKAEKALKELGLKLDEFAPRELLSVARIEKLCKERGLDFEALADLIVRPDGKPQLRQGEPPNVFATFAPQETDNPKSDAAIAAV